MTTEELKLVIEALSGLADGTITAAIAYMVLNFLTPILKYGIICVTVFKSLDLLTSRVKIEEKK